MIGFASTMRSPSIFRITRNTPCVDGCCGPKFTSISWTSNIGLDLPRHQLLEHRLGFLLAGDAEREVFRLPFCDRFRVTLAVPSARGAVGLRHRGEELVLEAAGFRH